MCLPLTLIPKYFVLLVLTSFCAVELQTVEAQTHYRILDRSTIELRLNSIPGKAKDDVRKEVLKKLFEQSGCTGESISEQVVKKKAPPNLICTLRGQTDEVILVGAHFDHVSAGDGVVDNWSGASLLPSLFLSLNGVSVRHTFVFVAFAGEEAGMVGSKFYVKNLNPDQRAKLRLMVNLDTLGLAPSEVWTSHSDKQLVNDLFGVAAYLKVPLSAVNVDAVGTTDSESFVPLKVPRITIHSLTQRTLPVLHSSKDNMGAIVMDDYYDSYRLLAGYLAYLDGKTNTSIESSAGK